MIAAVRPIHVPGASALESLRQRAVQSLEAWARDWVSGWANDAQRLAALHVRSEVEPTRTQHYSAVRTEAGCAWFRDGPADRLSFGRAIAGAELMSGSIGADDWITSIVDRAWEERNRTLCSALLGTSVLTLSAASQDALPHTLFALGSGAVQVSCEWLGLHAIFDSGVWHSVPPVERAATNRLAKAIPLDRALQRATTHLDVMLGSVEIELPKLLDLREGDVLRLPQRLDEGIAVLCEGKLLVRAALGELRGHKSVRISADPQ